MGNFSLFQGKLTIHYRDIWISDEFEIKVVSVYNEENWKKGHMEI